MYDVSQTWMEAISFCQILYIMTREAPGAFGWILDHIACSKHTYSTVRPSSNNNMLYAVAMHTPKTLGEVAKPQCSSLPLLTSTLL